MPNRKAKQRKMNRKKRKEAIKLWKRKQKLRKKELKASLGDTLQKNMGK